MDSEHDSDQLAANHISGEAQPRPKEDRPRSEWELDAASVVEKYRPYLKSIAAAEFPVHLRSRLDESDLVQETMFRACRTWSTFRGTTEAELRNWLREILKNQITDTVRFNHRQQRSVQREGAMPLQDPSCSDETPSAQFRRSESSEALWRAVAELPEDYRTVIMLHQQHRMTFPEIGERMQRSADAVRMLWARSVLCLAERLKHHRPEA